MTPQRFIQLDSADCEYLLNLIQDMDSDTAYTERQRGYTVPKLQKIQKDATSARLAFQDQEYLIALVEDDELPDLQEQRSCTWDKLQQIKALRDAEIQRLADIDSQRESRRNRRLGPEKALAAHFERTGDSQSV